MSDRITDIGSVCVFDAHKMVVGAHLELDNEVFIIKEISGNDRVVLEPVIGPQRWMYRLKKFYLSHKIAVIVGFFLVTSLILWSLGLDWMYYLFVQ